MLRCEFSRLMIVSRGEPAVRVIHAVRELNHGRADPIRLIAVHTEAERDATFVRQADQTVSLGDHDGLERAVRASRADAAWVGWGPVAERPEFAELSERLGIVFVGPDPGVMRRLRDETAAAQLAEEVGIPVGPSGRGSEQPGAGAHHVEVPIIADGHGAVWPTLPPPLRPPPASNVPESAFRHARGSRLRGTPRDPNHRCGELLRGENYVRTRAERTVKNGARGAKTIRQPAVVRQTVGETSRVLGEIT